MSITGAVGGIISGITNTINQHQQNQFNKEQWEWQKKKYEQSREDALNATYLKTKDLEKAGLNKALAMGGGISATTPPTSPQFQAPQSNMDIVGGIIGIAQQSEALKQQSLQNEALKQDMLIKQKGMDIELAKLDDQLKNSRTSRASTRENTYGTRRENRVNEELDQVISSIGANTGGAKAIGQGSSFMGRTINAVGTYLKTKK
ncbi:MAG: hypothetical protein ACRCS8_00590 [Brevinema sp.]